MTTADEKVQLLLKKVDEKRATVKKAEKPSWKTNCSFQWPGGSTQNLQVVADVKTLVSMLGRIVQVKNGFEDAQKALGTKLEFTFMNSTYADWEADIKTRIEVIQLASTRKELVMLEEKLNALMSPELKRQRELEEIEKLLA